MEEKLTRRSFLEKTAIPAAAAGVLAFGNAFALAAGKDFCTKDCKTKAPIVDASKSDNPQNALQGSAPRPARILPRQLEPGSTVAIIAPASHVALSEVMRCKRFLQKNDMKVEIGETVANLMLKRLKGDMSNFPSMFRLKTELLQQESVSDHEDK